jgi:hypothetical protein
MTTNNCTPDLLSDPRLSQSIQRVEDNQRFLLPGIETTYEELFIKLSEMQAEEIVIDPHCRFCNHALRADAEQKWEQTKGKGGIGSYTLVQKYLNDHLEPDATKFSVALVSSHIRLHYEQQVKKMWMQEYGKNFTAMMRYRVSKDQMFEAMIQSQQFKLLEVLANPELEEHKRVDLVTKLSKSICDVAMVQAKLRGDVDHIDVFKEKFQNIIVQFISGEPDDNKKKEWIQRMDMIKAELLGTS